MADVDCGSLKERRERLGFTLRDVEAITDGEISNAYLSQLENGKIKTPSLHIALILAAAYATSVEQLARWLGDDREWPKPEICGECGQVIKAQFAIDEAQP